MTPAPSVFFVSVKTTKPAATAAATRTARTIFIAVLISHLSCTQAVSRELKRDRPAAAVLEIPPDGH
jgi:hypothetical protein